MMDYLLFGLAWIGHGYALTVLLNIAYSQPYHRVFLKVVRAVIGLMIFSAPFLFAWYFGLRITDFFRTAGNSPPQIAVAVYLVVVLFASCVVLPIITIRRATRTRPAPILDESTTTIDVAKELGSPPYGDPKTAQSARLPFNCLFQVDFTTLTLALPNLPAAWDGLTLLQLSDLHFIGTPSQQFFEFVVQHCMREGIPDLVLLTGDIVDTETHHEWIAPILGRLRWHVGAFAILGNHDWWQDSDRVRTCLRDVGFRVVSNAWEQIEIRGEKLTVIGHEGPWFKPGPDLQDCPSAGMRLLLSHTPDNIRWARRNNVSLMLSGHNHGGQIRVPLAGSIFVPSKYSRRYDMGTFFEPPTLLHVNRGVSGKESLRIRCHPQVTRIILKRE
jgi:predicted MPP superfamily phosphohydrolase